MIVVSVEQGHTTYQSRTTTIVSVTTIEDVSGASVRTRDDASVHPVRRY